MATRASEGASTSRLASTLAGGFTSSRAGTGRTTKSGTTVRAEQLFFAVALFNFLWLPLVGSQAPAPSVALSIDPTELSLLQSVPAKQWNKSLPDPCQWTGISCAAGAAAAASSAVVGIQLQGEDPDVLQALLSITSRLCCLESLEFTNSTSSSAATVLPEALDAALQLKKLVLISAGVTGRIPPQLSELHRLQVLSLADNSLEGDIPAELCRVQSLERLDLSNNSLSGAIPQCLIASSLRFLDVSSNSGLSEYAGKDSSSSSRLWAILGTLIGVLVVLAAVAIALWVRRRRLRRSDDPEDATPSGATSALRAATSALRGARSLLGNGLSSRRAAEQHPQLGHVAGLVTFEYSELAAATGKFDPSRLLGRGAYGRVFRGELEPGGRQVAIKELVQRTPTCQRWFVHELLVLASVRHRNLVPLIGCCIDQRGFPLLVCEYMPNGSLQDALFGSEKERKLELSWSVRQRIAMDVARGLHYLHEDSVHGTIVHRDVKPANILLDANLNAHISDFGLARLIIDVDHHNLNKNDEEENKQEKDGVIVTSIMGTRGYLAPEYVLHGQLSDKADVYSYGIVLLELVSGRRGVQTSMDPAEVEPIGIDEWAWGALSSGRISEIADVRLRQQQQQQQQTREQAEEQATGKLNRSPKQDGVAGSGAVPSEEEVMQVVEIALWCTQGLPAMRPSMAQVMLMLAGHAPIPKLPPERISWDEFKAIDHSTLTASTTTVWHTASVNLPQQC